MTPPVESSEPIPPPGKNFRSAKPNNGNDGRDLQPLVSPAYEDVPMWSILPSYQLFQSTFSKNISPGNEDHPPPTYFTAPTCQPTPDHFFPQVPDENIDQPTRWEDTILANSHRLKKLHDFNQLRITVQLTKAPCKVGVPSQHLEHEHCEFEQGDPVHGYITIRNMAPFPLPFDMFSVVFEGKVSVMAESSEKKEPLVFHKFLNMFDYNASWTPVNFDDQDDDVLVDPVDNTRKRFSMDRYFEPNVTYKKFFNFRIPEKLLDCACETHNLQRHIQLLPSIGLAKDQFLKSIRKFREKGKRPELVSRKSTFNEFLDRRIKDFSFADTAISYSVEARVIGKSSDYESFLSKQRLEGEKDEFVMVNEASCFLRIIPKADLSYEFDSAVLDRQSLSVYKNLVKRVEERLTLGKQLSEEKPSDANEKTFELSRKSSTSKMEQLYPRKTKSSQQSQTAYEVFHSLKKKSLTLPPKIVALVGVSTEKKEYKIKYLPPYRFVPLKPPSYQKELSTSLEIPIKLTVQFNNECSSKSTKLPEIKSIGAELVALTYRSKKYPIPVEVTHDMIFKNKGDENDNFDTIIVKPFRKYLSELSDLMKKFNCEVLDVDSQLIMDMKSLANLQTKSNSFKIENVKSNYASTQWKPGASSVTMVKKLTVSLDLQSILSRETNDGLINEAHAMVPNFQSCTIGRSYYIVITVRLQNGDNINLKVPLRIVR